jgi:hypothetical protein
VWVGEDRLQRERRKLRGEYSRRHVEVIEELEGMGEVALLPKAV